MMRYGKAYLRGLPPVGLSIVLLAATALADDRERPTEKGESTSGAATQASDELSSQDREMVVMATEFAKEVTQIIDKWISSGAVPKERLFSYLYYPVADTSPTKFTTDYDKLADRDFQAVVDKYLARSATLIYAVASDKNGYVPTHNRQYSQPLTGNRAVDLVNNRTKRMFGDPVAIRASRNTKPSLLQRYERDTGEALVDLSVPITVQGRHWGCVRLGYRAVKQ
jgi:methyl-accepting chemotaxis protein